MLTPGVSVNRSSNLRPKIGVVLTAVSLSVVLDSVFIVSTVGVAVIVTRSATPETFMATGRLRAWPTVRSKLSATAVAKPCLETVTEYLPGGSARATKRPPSSVVRVLVKLVSRFLISTVAPGTIAPLASVTVPWIVPVVIWVCELATVAIANAMNKVTPKPPTIRAKVENLMLCMFSSVS